MMTRRLVLLVLLVAVTLIDASCSIGFQQPIDEASVIVSPTLLFTPTPTAFSITENANIVDLDTLSPTLVPRQVVEVFMDSPDFWMELPIIPSDVSNSVRDIYEQGLLMGNNPNAFSKVGDCHSTNPYFLADFDIGPDVYRLGEYSDLQGTIDYFGGSFGRTSLAAKQGLSTAGVLASLWSDWKQCESNETPLDCEFRLHHPSFALISLGTNEAYDVKLDKASFEGRLRRIIEHSIDQGVVPILSTKADNDEGDNYINFVTAKLAVEYELPLWNFWRAVQSLPQQGMRNADHLTFAPTNSFTDFSKPEYLEYGMQVRNLTALQMMDMIRREVSQSQTIAATTPTLQPVPEKEVVHQMGEAIVSPVDGMALVYIPSGDFEMGGSSGNPDETPAHVVSLDAYWMDTTEVTNAMFAKFLNVAGNQTEGGVTWLEISDPLVWVSGKDGTWQALVGKDNYPIVGVSWYGAKAYCEWSGQSLPTEAQWEYAARGMEEFRFPWGEDGPGCDRSQYLGCGSRPVEVGSLPFGASSFGVYEMAGNVTEWVGDRYAADYYQQSPRQNPTGPINGYYRVLRGGSWASTYIRLQNTHRVWAGADTRDSDIGFRCVLNP